METSYFFAEVFYLFQWSIFFLNRGCFKPSLDNSNISIISVLSSIDFLCHSVWDLPTFGWDSGLWLKSDHFHILVWVSGFYLYLWFQLGLFDCTLSWEGSGATSLLPDGGISSCSLSVSIYSLLFLRGAMNWGSLKVPLLGQWGGFVTTGWQWRTRFSRRPCWNHLLNARGRWKFRLPTGLHWHCGGSNLLLLVGTDTQALACLFLP